MGHQVSSGDYEVGYGKPPKEHQWLPGQSGNPRGRRSQRRRNDRPATLAESLARALQNEQVITRNGRREKIASHDLLAQMIIKEALTAPLKGKLQMILALGKMGAFTALESMNRDQEADFEGVFTEEDRRLLAAIERGLQHGGEGHLDQEESEEGGRADHLE